VRAPALWLLAMILAGCALTPMPEPSAPARPVPEPLPEVGAESEHPPSAVRIEPTATGTPGQIEESVIDEGPRAAPPPTVAAPGGLPPDGPSVLAAAGPTTAPNVTAALRLIEDGRQNLRQGQYDLALERFERSLSLDPNNPYAYYFLARLHFETRRYDQAVTFAGRAAALGSKLDPGWLGRAYELQGAAFEAIGQFAGARTAYRNAATADPLNAAARAGVARLTAPQPAAP
jgi:Flp pilus assembly protein TadD